VPGREATARDAQVASSVLSPELLVPAYFHPAVRSEEWERLVRARSRVRLVVVNPASGPGERRDESYLPVLDRLRVADVGLAGYVDTDYGRRSEADVLDDLERFGRWYGVASVFFDRVAAEPAAVGHYAALSRRSREIGAEVVVFHHGTHPVEDYAEHADVLGTFEGPWSAYLGLCVPRWAGTIGPGRICHIVYGVPRAHLADAAFLALSLGAGAFYATEHDGANPYELLPGNWYEPGAAMTGLRPEEPDTR
jgi:hypothetical protein